MSNLKQKLTYEQTWVNSIDVSGSVPFVSGASYRTSDVNVSSSREATINQEELVRELVTVPEGGVLMVNCDIEKATQCAVYIESLSTNDDAIEIQYVDEDENGTLIAVLYPGQALFLPFLVSITPDSGNVCSLLGTSVSGDQEVYVSSSHNG